MSELRYQKTSNQAVAIFCLISFICITTLFCYMVGIDISRLFTKMLDGATSLLDKMIKLIL